MQVACRGDREAPKLLKETRSTISAQPRANYALSAWSLPHCRLLTQHFHDKTPIKHGNTLKTPAEPRNKLTIN
jgi:hypothetical protein